MLCAHPPTPATEALPTDVEGRLIQAATEIRKAEEQLRKARNRLDSAIAVDRPRATSKRLALRESRWARVISRSPRLASLSFVGRSGPSHYDVPPTMADELDALLAEQVAYYRARAGEYDATSPLPRDDDSRAKLLDVLQFFAPRGRVLELGVRHRPVDHGAREARI